MSTHTIQPVRKSVTVRVSRSEAFEAFTAGMARWWRNDYTLGTAPLSDVTVEARPGGRWYETDADGRECEWGTVVVWEPPRRVVLEWKIDAGWKYSPLASSELEVVFRPVDDTTTVVELEHRGLEGLGSDVPRLRDTFDSPQGWMGLLESFAAHTSPT